MNDYMKARFADGVTADVLRFNIEDLCLGMEEIEKDRYRELMIKNDRMKVDRGNWRNGFFKAYIYPPRPKKRVILGLDGVSTRTYILPEQPTYRYSVVCANESKIIEVVWYDDAPPIYAGIYDVLQKMTEEVEFNRYAEAWN